MRAVRVVRAVRLVRVKLSVMPRPIKVVAVARAAESAGVRWSQLETPLSGDVTRFTCGLPSQTQTQTHLPREHRRRALIDLDEMANETNEPIRKVLVLEEALLARRPEHQPRGTVGAHGRERWSLRVTEFESERWGEGESAPWGEGDDDCGKGAKASRSTVVARGSICNLPHPYPAVVELEMVALLTSLTVHRVPRRHVRAGAVVHDVGVAARETDHLQMVGWMGGVGGLVGGWVRLMSE